jgi:FtsP/CotA-like multicopper oxidase with cupredoxin domain
MAGGDLIRLQPKPEKEKFMNKQFSRRDFLKLAGGAVFTVAGASLLPQFLRKTLLSEQVAGAAGNPDLYFAGTDGWIHLPPAPAIPPYFPDNLAKGTADGYPAGLNTYIFGFRNITGMSDAQKAYQKERAQHNAPLFWVTEGTEFKLQLTNLGLQMRPDLTDSHTLHWHGFRNVIPFFDGEPTGSISVPVGRDFTYIYRAHEPGTYMYHCHVEDVEHVHMGMTGLVFVRPLQDGNTSLYPSGKYAYNDGDGSTG